jgi:thioredoxin reductase (NADPH)
MSRYLIDEIENNERVEVITYHEVVELVGDQELKAAIVSDTRTGERHQLAVQALFVFIGADPRTDWLRGHVEMDDHGFVLAGRDIPDERLSGFDGDRPYFLETSQPGIFAVGDARSGSVKRVASAVGEGSMAVRLVHQRLETR